MKLSYHLLRIVASCVALSISAAKAPFKPLNTLFSTMHEETIHKEFTLTTTQPATLVIDNKSGSIKITGDPKASAVMLTATKRAASSAQLDTILISDSQHNDTITIKTVYANNKHDGHSVDYEMTVPLTTNVQLVTTSGPITIGHLDGTIEATTSDGTIELASLGNAIKATAHKTGSIIMHDTLGAIEAHANNGSIYIDTAHNSINAETIKGRIEVRCASLPTTSSLRLVTTTGPIVLYLPETIAAEINGKSDHATLTCQCPITLKPFTTTLNQKAWKKFKQEVVGTIGQSVEQLAHINLESAWGAIKILPA